MLDCFEQQMNMAFSPIGFPILPSRLALVAAFCLSSLSCRTLPEVDVVLARTEKALIVLERGPAHEIQRTHPITLPPDLLAQVLKGIKIQAQERVLQRALSGNPEAVPLFLEWQIHFLAPLLAQAFARAAPDQSIGFRIQNTESSTASEESAPATIAGSIYAKRPELLITLREYRPNPDRTRTNTLALRRPLEIHNQASYALTFVPETLARVPRLPGADSPSLSLAIDYERLPSVPDQSAQPFAPAAWEATSGSAGPAEHELEGRADSQGHSTAFGEKLKHLEREIQYKDTQIESLKRELDAIRRALNRQDLHPPGGQRSGSSSQPPVEP